MFNWYQLELFNWNIWGVYKDPFLGPFLVDGRKQKIKDDKKYRMSLYTAPCTGAYKDAGFLDENGDYFEARGWKKTINFFSKIK